MKKIITIVAIAVIVLAMLVVGLNIVKSRGESQSFLTTTQTLTTGDTVEIQLVASKKQTMVDETDSAGQINGVTISDNEAVVLKLSFTDEKTITEKLDAIESDAKVVYSEMYHGAKYSIYTLKSENNATYHFIGWIVGSNVGILADGTAATQEIHDIYKSMTFFVKGTAQKDQRYCVDGIDMGYVPPKPTEPSETTDGKDENDKTDPTEQTDPNEPVELKDLGQVYFDGKIIDINNFTKAELKEMGYKSLGVWSISRGNLNIGGEFYNKKDVGQIRTSINDEDMVVVIGTDENVAEMKFFKDITIADSIDDISEKLSDLEMEKIERSSGAFYLFHDKNNTMIVDVNEDGVYSICVAISREVNLNLSEGEKEQLEKEKLLQHFSQNDKKTWPGHNQEINCDVDLSPIVLEGKSFSIDSLTIDDLREAGFTNKKSTPIKMTNGDDGESINIYELVLTNDAGAEISCIYNGSGAVLYLDIPTIPPEGDFFRDEDDVQANYELFGGIYPGVSQDDLRAALIQAGIAAEDMSMDEVVLRNENIFMKFKTDSSLSSGVTIINAKLAWPQEETDQDGQQGVTSDDSLAEEDDAQTSLLTNNILLSIANQDIYDEIMRYACDGNVSCYADQSTEVSYEKNVTKRPEGGFEQYWLSDSARTADGVVWHAAGNMRGITITFQVKDGKIVIADGIINKFVQTADNQTEIVCMETKLITSDRMADAVKYSAEIPNYIERGTLGAGSFENLYNRLAAIGEIIELKSNKYRNSEYTVFIRTGEQSESVQDAIAVYGHWNGTNLPG